MEPWNFKKSKGRKPLRLEKEKKQTKILQKNSYASIEYSGIEQKASFDVNQERKVNSWDQKYMVQMWEALLTLLSVNHTKWSNTLKKLIGNSQRIVQACLSILWGCGVISTKKK